MPERIEDRAIVIVVAESQRHHAMTRRGLGLVRQIEGGVAVQKEETVIDACFTREVGLVRGTTAVAIREQLLVERFVDRKTEKTSPRA